MLLPCLSFSKAWITLYLLASLAQGRESTTDRFHGDILQKDRVSGHSLRLQLPMGHLPTFPKLSSGPSTTRNYVCFPAASPKGLSPNWPALHCPSFYRAQSMLGPGTQDSKPLGAFCSRIIRPSGRITLPCNPSILEVQGQPGLHSETVSKNKHTVGAR